MPTAELCLIWSIAFLMAYSFVDFGCLICFSKIFKSRNNKKADTNNSRSPSDQTIDRTSNRSAHYTQREHAARSVIEITSPMTANVTRPTSSPPTTQTRPARTSSLRVQVRKPTLRQDDLRLEIPSSPSSQLLLASPERSRRNSKASSHTRSNSNSSSTAGHWLKGQLNDARLECSHRAHCWIVPRSDQERLITVETVSRDIQDRNSEIDQPKAVEYAKKACETSRQLYAILAYTKNGADICSLLDEGITDADLPFVRKSNAPKKFALYRHDGQPIRTLETWKDQHLEKFDRCQWWFIAHIFRLYEELYELDDKAVLPFVSVELHGEELESKHGGYSEVYPVRIHPAHHEFWEGNGRTENEPLIAVKRLFNADETEYRKEATILNALNLKSHPHLIKLLATYKYEGKYHLMFPYANANLRKYWDDRPLPKWNRNVVLWSLRQMAGIASGLLLVHNFKVTIPLVASQGPGGVRMPKHVKLLVQDGEQWYGRHGDIKPENVLWFETDRGNQDPDGVLQIADFGLGRFHGRDSRSKVKPETVQTSPTYEPPECQLRMPVSRAYDIWGLGCLYLEFVTWLIMGSVQIEGFSDFRGRVATGTGIDDDNFFTIINVGISQHAVVRRAVVEWVDKLHKHEKSSQLIHDLLNLIMKDLLVIQTSERCTASWLVQQLNALLLRAEGDVDYMLKPVQYSPKPATDRSNSTPATFGSPSPRTQNNSFVRKEGTASPTIKLNLLDQPSKDLVQRNSGTPSFRVQSPLSAHPTWPMSVGKGQMEK
ncbi:hypothetical protein VTL71DRAFT_6239 [Oculimacula yallundae]|uniref:Protein kinase domain-containing protein n=1 Tax=Oculimacula yallundae TaxID=86028 RepID=A0ABR4C0S0_9HELO